MGAGVPDPVRRPLIDYKDGKFTHNGTPVRVVMRAGVISIGCSDITPEALKKLLWEHECKFSEVVLQP